MSEHFPEDPALDLFWALMEVDWPTAFDAATLSRGLGYAQKGRVYEGLNLQVGSDMLGIFGRVAGGRKQAYMTQVYLDPKGLDKGLFTLCNCPVGVRCKHAVALIETFMEQVAEEGGTWQEDSPEPAPGSPAESPIANSSSPAELASARSERLKRDWEAWLAAPAHPGPDSERVGEEYRLALFLSIPGAYRDPILRVVPVWVRPSRQSRRHTGWVAPRIIESGSHGLQPVPEGGWSADLEEALTLLLHGQRESTWVSGQVRGATLVSQAFQARALWRLLEAEAPPLLFHEKQTGSPLALGPAGQLAPYWQADEEGVQHLELDVQPADLLSPAGIVLRAGRELCYLDVEQGLFGRMAGDPEWLSRVERAPPLPPEMSGWLSERLREAPALAETLVAPHQIEERHLDDVVPRLKVTMQAAAGQLGFRDGAPLPRWVEVGAAVVSFDYAGIEVAPERGERVQGFRDGQRLIIRRDTEAELALVRSLPPGMVTLERLRELGVVPAYLKLPSWSLLLPVAGCLPATVLEWSTHLAGPDDWWEMIARLRQAGCLVEFDHDFPEEPTYLEPDDWYGELEPAGNGWFDLALDIEVEGERLNLLPILRRLFRDPGFPLEPAEDEAEDASWTLPLAENRRLVMPLSRLRSLMAPILDWLSDESDPEAALRLPVTAAEKVAPLAEHERWAGREDVTALASRLRALPASLPAPPGFTGELRDYQARGIAWMRFLSELGTGGILADDMGLGKTVQVLAHVLDERARGALTRPTLVVAPTSLVGNWCAEAERFAPELNVVALQGGKAQRERQFEEALPNADLAVTTYALLIRDLERLREHDFGLLVLDEAQAIKNAASQTARAVRELNVARAIAMTGTPLENHLGELWAQLDAVAPGALGSQQWFGQRFRTPIEKEGDVELRQRLSRRIAPLMLRRTKQQVLAELPEKTETRREVTLSGAQRELYESLRLAQHQRVQQAVAERGLAGSGIVMLDALLKLRQVCCDPRLVKLQSARKTKRSAKLQQLRELVGPLVEEGRRILIFSQFTEMLTLIGEALEKDGITFTTLTGDTPGKTRTQRVALFQQGEIPVFLISLKAGGTGLNLTAADTVIHYDPWWNPAVEAQATGRAHRMGQQNPVFVYKLVCAGTVEERILDLQARKADLAASILEGGAERPSEGPMFDEEDLALLFAPVV
ncbi:SNF2-related protein [Halomonas alkalicola]|uniref:DEAD/DEAH box helicase n=1 Tax=Halomonas alkalicola TaxID=1930622 RepID=UPI0035E71E8A